jgi:hypothetical protein
MASASTQTTRNPFAVRFPTSRGMIDLLFKVSASCRAAPRTAATV